MSENKESGIFLESDPSILENNLKFVKTELEEQFEQIFDPNFGKTDQTECKVIQPEPGLCIKCFKTNTNEKFFINLCTTTGIPAPEDISEDELTKILQSEQPSSFRIPMSISEPRLTKDKSGNSVDVCDIAVNLTFFTKCETKILLRDFLIALILEALDDKYKVTLNANNWLILKNRKFIGTLVTHRVQKRDVKTVYESYKNPSTEQKKFIQEIDRKSGKKLIEEIDENELKKLKKNSNEKKDKSNDIRESISMANSKIPEHKIFSIQNSNGEVEQILAEFYLPECISINETTLDIGEDRIYLESTKRGYLFDKFIDFKINQDKIEANFNRKNKMLQVKMALL